MLCNKCGRQVIDGANFCPFCGADLRYQRNNNSGLSGYINPNDETNFGYTLLSFFMPYIGLVLYIITITVLSFKNEKKLMNMIQEEKSK